MQLKALSLTLTAVGAFAAALAAVVDCGGPQINMEQLANQPGMHRTGALTITVAGQTASYKSAEADADYDPSTHVLSLYLLDSGPFTTNMLLHTTCNFESYNNGSGQYVIVRIKDFDPAKPGTYSATDADIVTVDSSVGPPSTKKGALDGVTFTVTRSDNDRIVGTISGANAKGDVDAWPCFVDGGPGGAPTPAPTSSAAPADSAAAPASSSSASADAGAAADDTSTPAPVKKKKKKKSGG